MMLTQTLELHENQRCWMGKGFTGALLLPNDRGRISLTDASQSWKSLEEASDNVLGLGWKWADDRDGNNVTTTTSTTNTEDAAAGSVFRVHSDWMYARDFSPQAVRDAQPQRGPLHWVRFRTLQRTAVWDGEELFADNHAATRMVTRHHCDSKVVGTLANALLEVLTYAVIVHDGISSGIKNKNNDEAAFKEATVLRIKSNLMLHLLHFRTDWDNQQEADAFYQMDMLHESLQNFAESERTSGLRSVFSTIPSFAKRQPGIPDFARLCHIVSEKQFGISERNKIATLMVQKLDPNGQMQCKGDCTDDSCIYIWQSCPNTGCDQVMSRLYLESHVQDECLYQPVHCDCGDSFLRHQQALHLTQVCPLRDATCPFAPLGCCAVLPAKEVPSHVQNDTSAHLLLSLRRMMQYEEQFRQLRARIEALELENKSLQRACQVEQTKAAQSLASCERTLNALQKRVNTVERKGNRGIQQLKTEMEKSHVK